MCGGGSCVGLNQFKSHLVIEKVKTNENTNLIVVKGQIKNRPASLLGQTGEFLQSMVTAQQLAQLFNGGFHLFSKSIKAYSSLEIFQLSKGLHEAAHLIDECVDATSIVRDGIDLKKEWIDNKRGSFFTYLPHSKKINFTRTTARVCHFIAHGIKTFSFLSSLNLVSTGALGTRIIRYGGPLFHILGFSLLTGSLIWRRYIDQTLEKDFTSNMIIQTSGFIFQASNLSLDICQLGSTTVKVVSYIGSFSGITSNLAILNRTLFKGDSAFNIEVDKKDNTAVIKTHHH